MPPAAQAYPLTDRQSLEDLLSQNGVELRAGDPPARTGDPAGSDADGAYDAAELRRIATAVGVGTAKVLRYARRRYDAADLATSWSAWEWATCFGAVWLCRRRGNPVPEELLAYAADCLAELQAVQSGTGTIGDIGERVTDGPALSVTTLDPRFRSRQIRVNRRLGDRTPRERPPAPDYTGELLADSETFGG